MTCLRCYDRREVIDHSYDARERITKPCPACVYPETEHARHMWRIGATFALLMAFGCGRPPEPEGIPLAADHAVKAALAAYGEPQRTISAIHGVPSNCGWDVPEGHAYGFVDPATDRCVGGLTTFAGIYLVLQPGIRYSHVLCHEVWHALKGDYKHENARAWGEGANVEMCNAHLRDTLGPEDFITWEQ